jgi:glycosyltransferase involved in cell wall biosynthesis
MAALVCGSRFVVSRRVAFPIGSSLKYSRPVHYLAVSCHVQRILEQGGVPARKITVVPDGVPIPAEVSGGDAVVVPASDDPGKGQRLAVEACRAAGVEALVSRDLESDLRRAAVLLYLTEAEGLGSAALLAMAYGVPVIASRVGGLVEVVEDGLTGLHVENNAHAIAAALRALLDDPARRQAMAQRARDVAVVRFTIEGMVSATAGVYRKVLAHR